MDGLDMAATTDRGGSEGHVSCRKYITQLRNVNEGRCDRPSVSSTQHIPRGRTERLCIGSRQRLSTFLRQRSASGALDDDYDSKRKRMVM